MSSSRFATLALVLSSAAAVAQPPGEAGVTPAPLSKKTPVVVTYDKGLLFTAASGDYTLKLAFKAQVRFDSTRPTDPDDQFVSHFFVPRSRMVASGTMFGDSNRYRLELGLGEAGNFAYAKDVFLEKRVAAAPIWLRVGQWTRPFSRHEVVSDFTTELAERANVAAYAGVGRDIGIALHNDYETSPDGFEWVVGVFNGFGGAGDRPALTATCTQEPSSTCTIPTPSTFPADFGPTAIARVGWNTGGIKGYSEGDLEGGGPRLAIGAAYKIDFANFAKGTQSTVAENLRQGLEADAMFKAYGFSLEGGVYALKLRAADTACAAFVQPGFFVVPKVLELAARLSYAPSGAQHQTETRIAIDWYWRGHAWKWSTDLGRIELSGVAASPVIGARAATAAIPAHTELQLRTMLQLVL